MRSVRTISVLFVCWVALAFVPASAFANNDNYACELLPSSSFIKHIFGLPHFVMDKKDEGGTDEDEGAFTSTCIAGTYAKPPHSGVNPFGHGKVQKTRKGFAEVQVSATVQDEGEGGDNWDPEKLEHLNFEAEEILIEDGGRNVGFPKFGKMAVFGWEWPLLADNASGLWEDGEEGFVTVTVHAHGGSGQDLANLAQSIVHRFNP